MNTLICVLCCMVAICPVPADIDNYIIGNYDNVNYVGTVEYDGKYVVGMMTDPFYAKSDKIAFVNKVKDDISKKYGIDKAYIEIVFDIRIIHKIKCAKSEENFKLIIESVYHLK